MNDTVVGVRLVGDGKQLQNEVRLSREALRGINTETQAATKAAAAARQATEDYARALKKEYDTVGMTTAQIKKYEVAQLAASDAEKKAMNSMIDATASAQRRLETTEKLGRVLGRLVVTGTAAAVAVAGVVTKQSLDAAMQAEQSYARLQAMLNATGHSAGLTADEIEGIVQQLAKVTAFDDESLRDAAASMLIFGNISRDTFERALRGSVNLASALKIDLNSAVMMLGKALQDPEEGLLALQRAGIKFTDTQKIMISGMIDQGRQTEALTFILDELKRRGIDGTAEALNTGLTKAYEGNKKSLNELFEALGQTEAIGGSAMKKFGLMKDLFTDITAQIDGTSNAYSKFLEQLSKDLASSGLFQLASLVGLGASALDNSGRKPKAPPTASFTEQLAAQDGRATAWQQQQKDLAEKRFREATALREKDLQAEQVYLDAVYKMRSEYGSRTLALEEFLHANGLKSDSAFFASKAAIAEQGARDEIARIQSQMAITKQLEANANDQVAIAKTPEERVNAESKVVTQRGKLRELTLQLASAEEKLLDVERQRAREQYTSDAKLIDSLTKISYDTDDYVRSLKDQTDEMRLQLDLTGQSEADQAIANNQRKLAVQYEDQRRRILRDIADLQANGGSQDEIDAKRRQLEILRETTKVNADVQAGIIKRQFALNDELKVWDAVGDRVAEFGVQAVDAMVHGKSAVDVLINGLKNLGAELLALTLKRWVLQIVAGVTGNGALASQAGQLGSGTISGAITSGIGSWLGGTSWGGAASQFWGGMTGSIVGPAQQGTALAYGQQFSTALSGMSSALIGVTAVIGAVIASWQLYNRGWGVGGDARLDSGVMTTGINGTMFGAGESQISGAGFRIAQALGINDKWASILSGQPIVARTFGHGATHADAFGLSGSFNGMGFTGSQWQDYSQRGGVFSSDRRWTDNTALTGDQTQLIDSLLAPVKTVISHLSERFGVNPNTALAGYSRDFNVQLTENGEMKSDEELNAMFQELMVHVLQDQVSRVLDAGGNTKLADYVRGLTGSADEIGKTIQNVLDLMDAVDSLDAAIASLEGGPMGALEQSLKDLDDGVDKAKDAFNTALEGADPEKVNAAQQALTQAVMDRYTTEMNMVRELQDAIRQLEEQAYQFALNIAQRINAVGGSRDIGGIAMNRAIQLQAGVGSGPVATQIQNLQGYVGAIDTWYQARRSAIEQEMQAEIAAQQAIYQAAAQAASMRVAALQKELALAQSYQALVEQTQKMLDDMRLTTANPLSLSGRQALAQQDVDRLRKEYESAKGEDKVTAANKLLEALQTLKSLGMENNDRPSQEWQDLYNEIVSEITAVQKDAKSQADRAVDIQKKIYQAQQQATMYGSMTATASQASSDKLAALDAEALGYYTWAEAEGERLYKLQIQQHQEQLDLITGGQEVELWMAAKQGEMVAILKDIRAGINSWLTNPPAGSAVETPPGGAPGAGAGSPGGSGKPGSGAPAGTTLVMNFAVGMQPAEMIDHIVKHATVIKRRLQTA